MYPSPTVTHSPWEYNEKDHSLQMTAVEIEVGKRFFEGGF